MAPERRERADRPADRIRIGACPPATISHRSRADARLLWDHHLMHHDPRPCSVAIGLGSHDLGDRLVIDMLVGTLQRLMIYPAQGFMAADPVPGEVVAADERLRRAGFTSRLVADAGRLRGTGAPGLTAE